MGARATTLGYLPSDCFPLVFCLPPVFPSGRPAVQDEDKAVMVVLLSVYAGALAFSASLAYRHAGNSSPVTYYSDPRYHNLTFEAHDFEGFLETFNQPPKDCSGPDGAGSTRYWVDRRPTERGR